MIKGIAKYSLEENILGNEWVVKMIVFMPTNNSLKIKLSHWSRLC